jgi:hypothetical protein
VLIQKKKGTTPKKVKNSGNITLVINNFIPENNGDNTMLIGINLQYLLKKKYKLSVKKRFYKWYIFLLSITLLHSISLAQLYAPTLVEPRINATNIDLKPLFWWNTNGASSYKVQVSKSKDFSDTNLVLQGFNLTGGTWSPSTSDPDLPANSTLYWRVVAYTCYPNNDGSGCSHVSATPNMFTTASSGKPPAPVLSSPANGAINVDRSPTLSWNPSKGATQYIYRVSFSDQVFSNDKFFVNEPTSSIQFLGLPRNQTFYWMVKASNSAGSSAYSGPISFTTKNTTESDYDPDKAVAYAKKYSETDLNDEYGGRTYNPFYNSYSFFIDANQPGTCKFGT